MKVVSINVNGLFSAYKKGLFDYIKKNDDFSIVCFQETRLTNNINTSEVLLEINAQLCDYQFVNFASMMPGFGGVGFLISNDIIQNTTCHIVPFVPGNKKSIIGRIGILLINNELCIINVYLHYSKNYKIEDEYFLDKVVLITYLQQKIQDIIKQGYQIIVCGDFNITCNNCKQTSITQISNDFFAHQRFVKKRHFLNHFMLNYLNPSSNLIHYPYGLVKEHFFDLIHRQKKTTTLPCFLEAREYLYFYFDELSTDFIGNQEQPDHYNKKSKKYQLETFLFHRLCSILNNVIPVNIQKKNPQI